MVILSKKKSFTLIEILVATTVFVIAMVIFLASLSLVMKPRAKSQSENAVQETLKLAMDKISNNTLRINSTYPVYIKNYYGFAFTDGLGRPLTCTTNPCPNPGPFGHRINFDYYIGFPSSYEVIESFGVYQGGNFIDGDCDPVSGPCVLQLWRSVDGGATAQQSDISGPDVDITSFNVKGFFWSGANGGKANNVTPYAEVAITAQSRYANTAEGAKSMTMKTLINPIYKAPYYEF